MGSPGRTFRASLTTPNFPDRVSQIGPAEGPSAAVSGTAGNISPGAHQCVVSSRCTTLKAPGGGYIAAVQETGGEGCVQNFLPGNENTTHSTAPGEILPKGGIGGGRSLRRRFRHRRQYFAGRASVRGDFRYPARLLDRALAAHFLDRGGQQAGGDHQYPHRAFQYSAAPIAPGFTASGGASFYNVPATMTINDNATTSLTVDFTDTILLSGTSMDYLFSQIELPEQLGVAAYVERLFWWGERANMDNWSNLTFDGGWDASGSGRPLGWLQDTSFGAGGSREPSDVVWGDAYRITADGVNAARGMIEQNAIADVDGDPLFANNTDYSVRARIKRSIGLSAGTLRINAYSPTHGQLRRRPRSQLYAQTTTTYQGVHRRSSWAADFAAFGFNPARLRGRRARAFGRIVSRR